MFYDQINSEQEGWAREPIETIVNLVMIELWGEVDDDIEIEFPSLWQLDDAGKSAIQKTKADQRQVDIEVGIITPEEGRLAAARDPDSQYAGLDLHKPLPEPVLDPSLMEEGSEAEGEAEPGAQPMKGARASRRDLGGMTSQSAKFGGATTGGFSG
jgi:hypothetical protein